MRTKEEIRKLLDEKIPRDVISQREGGNGVKLDYLEGHYVIARMNEIFGQGNWDKSVEVLEKIQEKTVDRYNNDVFNYTVVVKCTLQASFTETKEDGTFYRHGTISNEDIGSCTGTSKRSYGDALEMAFKGAVTDAFKRAAKDLGMSMGLALYSKDQENVEDEKTTNKAASSKSTTVGSDDQPRSSVGETSGATAPNGDARSLIKSAAQVLNAKKKLTIAQFKKKYTQDKSSDQLTDAEVNVILKSVATDYPELNLA